MESSLSSPRLRGLPQPFTVDIPQPVLDDLHERLAHTRWPDEIAGAGWDYGVPLAYLRELVAHWRERFDWRAQERSINRLHHYHADVDGLAIHFIHERGHGPNPLPLILTHGWPSAFYEMDKVISLLTDPARYGGDPADAFDVVVPSLPGYGFSDPYPRRGQWNVPALWAALMEGLGYAHYGAQGGDIGAGVTTLLGRYYPERLVGIHLSSIVGDPYPLPDPASFSEAERAYMLQREEWEREEGGYSHIQGTRPQTLAYGLTDSPVGLAAWIVEKFRAWSDCGGDIARRFSKDELLTIVTLYWATQTINSSIRRYYESQHAAAPAGASGIVTVPTAVTTGMVEPEPPREWAERRYNIQRWVARPRGGHFLAMEEPEWFVEDVRAFFRDLR
jgi:pimeloyl-ACP methyl ester carboxylesterase